MFRENPDLSSDTDIYDEERRSNTKSRHIFIGNLSHPPVPLPWLVNVKIGLVDPMILQATVM